MAILCISLSRYLFFDCPLAKKELWHIDMERKTKNLLEILEVKLDSKVPFIVDAIYETKKCIGSFAFYVHK